MDENQIRKSVKEPIYYDSNVLLDILFDQSNVMIAHMDTQFNFIRVSKEYAEADKKEMAYFIGKNHFDLYPNIEHKQIFQRVVETGTSYHGKAKDFKDAEYLDCGMTSWDWSLNPIVNSIGEVSSLVLTISNITAQKKIEEEFLQEKKFTEAALNAQRDTFFVFNPATGKAIRWNKVFEEISEYSHEEISNLKAPESYYPIDEINQLIEAIEIIEQGGTTIVESNLITKNGNLIPFEYIGSGIFDQEGNLKYIVAIGRDITERKIREEKLKESEEKFRTIAEQAVVGISIIQDNQVKYVNQRLLDYFGYTKEEVEKWPPEYFINVVHPDFREIIMEISRKNQLDEAKGPSHVEIKTVKKSGELQWTEIYIRSIIFNGKPASMNINVDISERKKAEHKLRESEEKYRSLVEGLTQTGIGVDIVDSNYNVIYQNQFLKEYFGDLQNKKCYDHYLNRDTCCEDCPMIRAIQNNRVEKEIIVAPNDRIYEVISAPLPSPSGIIERAAEVVIDITEAKRLEELKSEFLNRASHELITPLVGIIGYTELLTMLYESKLDEMVVEFLDYIKNGTEKLKQLSNKLVNAERLNTKTIELEITKSDIKDTILQCVNNLYGYAKIRNISFDVHLEDNLIFNYDAERIHEVFDNLILNAIKYSLPGNSIKVQAKCAEKNVLITVKDEGIGITEEEQQRIFKKFGKIEHYGKKLAVDINGVGMGLYIAKKIVQLHNGKIWLKSEGRNKGSTFYVSLPFLE